MCNLGGDLCPVKIYKEFHKRRPKEACLPNSRVYLQPVRKPSLDNDDVWFVNVPLGKNTIGSIAKKMFADAGLASTRKTNHSGRKTAIQTLLHAGVAPTEVQQLSGHKNVQSLNAYSTLSTGQQQQLSNILSKSINPKDLDTASVPRLASVQDKDESDDFIGEVTEAELALFDLENEVYGDVDKLANVVPTSAPVPVHGQYLTVCTTSNNVIATAPLGEHVFSNRDTSALTVKRTAAEMMNVEKTGQEYIGALFSGIGTINGNISVHVHSGKKIKFA